MVWIPLKPELRTFLKDCQKVVILTIGNELRGDDGLGPLFAQNLSSELEKSPIKNGQISQEDKIIIIDGGMVPENFTGSIRKENPTHIIIVDAVEMDKKPGTIKLINKDKIAQYNVSTHAMPLSFLIKYLETTGSFKVCLVGMQPKTMELGDNLSQEVKESVKEMVTLFYQVFCDSEIFP